MDAKINIAKILKDKPRGTKLYSTVHGKCSFEGVTDEIFKINFCTSKFGLTQTGECTLIKFGNMFDGGECIVFPSREMRDWSKFAWMKGDVLVNDDKDVHIIFEAFENNTYTRFKGKHYLWKEGNEEDYAKEETYMLTSRFEKVNDDAVKCYINAIEERLGGKLNRESLEVEKAQPEFKDGDIAFADYGNRQYVFIVSGKTDLSEGYNSFIALDLRGLTLDMGCMSFFKEDLCKLRLATKEEKQQLFDALEKEGKAWDAEKKQIVDLKPAFEIGKLYVFNEEDEDGELTIIGKLIGKNEIEDTLTFGNQYEIENEKFVTDQAFDLRISVHKELREATEGEAITFHEAYTIWEKSKKQLAFKPFDKVLVRDSKSDNWRANLFSYIGKDGYYHCVYANWAYCIPYEGNEHLLGTTKDVEG